MHDQLRCLGGLGEQSTSSECSASSTAAVAVTNGALLTRSSVYTASGAPQHARRSGQRGTCTRTLLVYFDVAQWRAVRRRRRKRTLAREPVVRRAKQEHARAAGAGASVSRARVVVPLCTQAGLRAPAGRCASTHKVRGSKALYPYAAVGPL